jgi:hypothetical protein
MNSESRATMARIHTLPDGERVRLRMARARDEESLRALLRRVRLGRRNADPGALARFDPRHEVVVCATALVDSRQEVVGVGAADLDGQKPPEVAIDERRDRALAELLRRALEGRVRARRRR